jgi:hypothetical protein
MPTVAERVRRGARQERLESDRKDRKLFVVSQQLLQAVGAWLSLARAPGSGPGGRWFKSIRPDHFIPLKFNNFVWLSLK